MAGETPELIIKTTVDAGGAVAGADATKEAIKGIGAAAEGAGDQTNKFVEHLGSMRGGRMAAMELFETLQGGGATIEGITGLLRLFILTSTEIAGPIGLAFAGVALAFTSVWAAHQKGSADAKESTDTLKASQDAMAASLKAAGDVYASILKDTLGLETQIETMHKQEVTDIRDAATEAQKRLDLDKEIAIEKARQDYLVKSGATNDPEEKKRLEAEFNATKAGIEGNSEKITAALEFKVKQDELNATKKALAQQQDALEKAQNEIAAIQKQRTDDALALAHMEGVVRHGTGEAGRVQEGAQGLVFSKPGTAAGKPEETPLLDVLQKMLDAAIQTRIDAPAYNVAHAGTYTRSSQGAEYIEKATQRVEELQALVAQAKGIQGRASTADSDESIKSRQGNVDALDKTIFETQQSLAKLAPAVEDAQRGLTLATLKASNDVTQAQQNAAAITKAEVAKKKFEDDKADRDTTIEHINSQLKTATDAALKDILEKEKAGLEAEGVRDKANYDYQAGTIDKKQRDDQLQSAADVTTGANKKGGANPPISPLSPGDQVLQNKADAQALDWAQRNLIEQAAADPGLQAKLRELIDAHKDQGVGQQIVPLLSEYTELMLRSKQEDAAAIRSLSSLIETMKEQITALERGQRSLFNSN